MKTIFNKIDNDWKLVKNSCRNTVGKEYTENEATEEFKKNLLISEHTPIRLINISWRWKEIYYFVAMEWARHKFEKFITSQRNDRQSNYDRNEARQDAPVNFDGYANMQNLIDAWRKRLCYCATKEARELAEDFKLKLAATNKAESDVLVPNCIYRFGCPEFKTCGYFKRFIKWCTENEIFFDEADIKARYDAYNQFFREVKKHD